jgi:hypothetical protein
MSHHNFFFFKNKNKKHHPKHVSKHNCKSGDKFNMGKSFLDIIIRIHGMPKQALNYGLTSQFR